MSWVLFLQDGYLNSPTRDGFYHAITLSDSAVKGLDLSQIAEAARNRAGRASALELYETLNRIPLPPWEEIPDASALGEDAKEPIRWIVPDTEIVLVGSTTEDGTLQFLFSPNTVERSEEFYEKVKDLPYVRKVPLENLGWILASTGGWLIPYSWVDALPQWLQRPVGGQSVWKWILFVVFLGVAFWLFRWIYILSRYKLNDHPVFESLLRLILPASVLLIVPVFFYLTRVQLKFIGNFAVATEVIDIALLYLAGAWLAWRAAPVAAEAVIASPRISPESIDAHLIRIFTRLLGLAMATGLVLVGADHLGVHAYGILAGLGVGGLAIALAAQSTIENLIGGFSLFADKPIRVGDVCMYGKDVGKVEAIGIRSTRIRNGDRTLTSIPNGMLSKMPIVNLTVRDQLQIRTHVNLRRDTSPEQLRYVITKLRELLLAHSMVTLDRSRVRLVGFGESSLDLQVNALIETTDWNEFLGVQEDLLMRIMEVVAEAGTGLALPSQTLYFARDSVLDAERTEAAEKEVQQWREEQKLPFPEIDSDRMDALRHTVDYPPKGSAKASPPGEK
tara:strand:+ start:220 stop:1905 length:1686 start_codon:yes stop_codon:yes gene_type:complete